MTLIRLKPARELLRDSMVPASFVSMIDSVFNDSLGKFERNLHFSPRVDVVEKKNQFEIHVSLPGMKKEEVQVRINDGFVVISGERKFTKQNDETYHAVENFYGNFERSFELPSYVDAGKIEAEMNDGILKVFLPKTDANSNSSTITIK